MNLLFLDAYFEPEQIAFTHLEHDLLVELGKRGNTIYVICPTPTRGISDTVRKEYRNIKRETIYEGIVQVKRFYAPAERKNPLVRALRYFWCNVSTYIMGKQFKGADVVFCNSTPPTQGLIAGAVAKKLKVPFVYSLQDMFPDSLVATGLTRNGSLLWRAGRVIEYKTYRKTSKIVAIAEDMKKELIKKGVEAEKITVIRNWIDTDQIRPINREDNPLFEECAINRSAFIVVYAGNMGEAQGASIILEVSDRLSNVDDIVFVVFGGGSGFEQFEKDARKRKNIFVHPLLPINRVSDVYSMGDVVLITCKKGVGKSGVPSKTWSIMATGRPVIASFDRDSELSQLIMRYGTGTVVEPENVSELTEAILSAYQKPSELLAQGHLARDYAVNHLNRTVAVTRFADLIEKVAEIRKNKT